MVVIVVCTHKSPTPWQSREPLMLLNTVIKIRGECISFQNVTILYLIMILSSSTHDTRRRDWRRIINAANLDLTYATSQFDVKAGGSIPLLCHPLDAPGDNRRWVT